MKISGICGKKTGMLRNVWLLAVVATLALSFSAGAVMASGGGDGEHGAEPKGWVATDTYRVMNFAVLAVALFFILRKPASRALDDRIQGIRAQLSELEAKKKEAEGDLLRHNEKLANLEREAEKIVEGYVRQGEEAKARILKEAEASALKLEEQARRNIEHEFERAKRRLQADIIEKALEKAETAIKSGITAGDQDRLVNEYLKKVVA
jgi:F-type H+-transporting ATPase subunit b